MALSDMEVFNTYFMPATIETLAQMVEKFNAASGGAILLTTDGFDGDFLQTSFYAGLAGARRRVDRYGPNNTVTPVDLTQIKHNTVKVAGGFGPVRYEPGQMTWLRKPTAEGIEVASRYFAESLLQDQLNTAIAALVAAISNQGASATVDVSGSKKVDYIAVNDSHALFGDNSSRLIAQVMDGAQFHAFVGQNLTNAEQLFKSDSVRVVDILGRLVVVTDAPALYSAATTTPTAPAKRRVLSLTQGAATVHDTRDLISNIDTSNGGERISTTLQIDYTFGVGLRGYAWDTANGGASPTDAALATGSNWDKVVDSVKHTAGVLAIGQA
ncbi:major capsid protein [Pseudomonas sp. 21LCFQ02]|uniref:major capsid protein n=1 Tax=Pseudomonas sp. 21LCFQ02 TaxID=2957505 RepID=UPI00209B4587|nr:major capsid protein [Pseudomonas sp. 21LCFQ02]MCO8166839.1 major capsid protein [Pseudomonas sp. 21LCFQ02]